MTENPADDIMDDLKKPEKEWAAEGYKLATEFVYTVKEGELPSDDYVK